MEFFQIMNLGWSAADMKKKFYKVVDLQHTNFMDYTEEEPMTEEQLIDHFKALADNEEMELPEKFDLNFIQDNWEVRFEETDCISERKKIIILSKRFNDLNNELVEDMYLYIKKIKFLYPGLFDNAEERIMIKTGLSITDTVDRQFSSLNVVSVSDAGVMVEEYEYELGFGDMDVFDIFKIFDFIENAIKELKEKNGN